MSCCNSINVPFVNELITTVPYTGTRPMVEVAYLQPDNTFLVQGNFNQIQITPTDVVVDHGGLQTGVVKLYQ